MKIKLALLLVISTFSLTAQVDTLIIIQDHNFIEKKCNGSRCKYWVDNLEVTKTEYEKHLNEPTIASCKPCYLKQTDKNGIITYEGDFYTDCCIGIYIERYLNGIIKVKGQYKIPLKEQLVKDIYNLGYCRKEGEWKYYKENGEIEKIEFYKDGIIIN